MILTVFYNNFRKHRQNLTQIFSKKVLMILVHFYNSTVDTDSKTDSPLLLQSKI